MQSNAGYLGSRTSMPAKTAMLFARQVRRTTAPGASTLTYETGDIALAVTADASGRVLVANSG